MDLGFDRLAPRSRSALLVALLAFSASGIFWLTSRPYKKAHLLGAADSSNTSSLSQGSGGGALSGIGERHSSKVEPTASRPTPGQTLSPVLIPREWLNGLQLSMSGKVSREVADALGLHRDDLLRIQGEFDYANRNAKRRQKETTYKNADGTVVLQALAIQDLDEISTDFSNRLPGFANSLAKPVVAQMMRNSLEAEYGQTLRVRISTQSFSGSFSSISYIVESSGNPPRYVGKRSMDGRLSCVLDLE